LLAYPWMLPYEADCVVIRQNDVPLSDLHK
jgi:hypothetical protein